MKNPFSKDLHDRANQGSADIIANLREIKGDKYATLVEAMLAQSKVLEVIHTVIDVAGESASMPNQLLLSMAVRAIHDQSTFSMSQYMRAAGYPAEADAEEATGWVKRAMEADHVAHDIVAKELGLK